MSIRTRVLAGVCLAALLLAGRARAQSLTAAPVLTGLDRPVWAGSPPGDDRIFVLEQHTNLIRIVEDGAVTGTFLDLSSIAEGGGVSFGERGLLGLVFHPDFARNGRFFVHYTAVFPPGTVRVARYEVSAGDPDLADPASGVVLFELPHLAVNHKSAALSFGPDGYLYVTTGDGGGVGNPTCTAQDPTSLMGKMLRLDVDSGPGPYAIPPDNPFAAGGDGILDEIWHFGLRNPWRSTVDPLTGDVYVGDVGEATREEISFAPGGVGGLNFGWKVLEGTSCYQDVAQGCTVTPPGCADSGYTPPLVDYAHGDDGCCVIGGVVYRGCALPALQGTYWYADFCSGKVWSMVVEAGAIVSGPTERQGELFGDALPGITAFGVDGAGEILITTLAGDLLRIEEAGGATDCDADGTADACQIAADPLLDLDADGGLDACQELSADVATVSIAGGGLQTLSLHHEPQHADQVYWLVGSTSGTSPGLDGDGQHLPLNPDDYFSFTLGFPNIFPLVDSLGILDGNAEATAGFFVPAGVLDGSLAGLTFHHAYAVLELGPITVVATSNAIPVTLAL